MRRCREEGIFVGYDSSSDAFRGIDRFCNADQAVTIPHPVSEIFHEQIARKLV
jgi:hypothetical protein